MQVQLQIPRMLWLLRTALSCREGGDALRSPLRAPQLCFHYDLFLLLQCLVQPRI